MRAIPLRLRLPSAIRGIILYLDVTLLSTIGGRPHYVTTNLEVALWYIRKTNETRIMWINPLRINQRDIEERNHQVCQMRSIYLNAKQVMIWLGEEGDARLALDYCRSFTHREITETERYMAILWR
jgi:hypothetical protein